MTHIIIVWREKDKNMIVYGLNKTTLLDYPGYVAATIFTGSCNFRCPFCHNKGLVLNPGEQPQISDEEIDAFLKKRQGITDGICITGGEPTLQKDLKQFITKIKDYGYKVKLDTNGYRPEILEDLISSNLLDYVAMDIKSGYSGYGMASGVPEIDIEKIKKSIAIIKGSLIEYEFRTTCVKGIHTARDFEEITELIGGAKNYYLQDYRDNENVLSDGWESFSRPEMEKFLEVVSPKVLHAEIRGVD